MCKWRHRIVTHWPRPLLPVLSTTTWKPVLREACRATCAAHHHWTDCNHHMQQHWPTRPFRMLMWSPPAHRQSVWHRTRTFRPWAPPTDSCPSTGCGMRISSIRRMACAVVYMTTAPPVSCPIPPASAEFLPAAKSRHRYTRQFHRSRCDRPAAPLIYRRSVAAAPIRTATVIRWTLAMVR